ncbi:BTAD domain-containing putative transcriptional regulator [Planomonospora corallina]|uniref:BTAD domain-containing putative transcriptional regulator n=1 Tax=Planomonospora corallina TaxID=1806052 RepID=A0ABV8I6C7_9ACTN
MEFLMLGPLEIAHGGRSVSPTAAKDRAFLGELLAHPGQLVSGEHLAAALWPDRLPADPANAVQVRASRLRGTLRSIAPAEVAGKVLVSRSGGYELNLENAETDVFRFEAALALGDLPGIRRGLALWRGAPLSDVPPTPCVEIQAARLEELRLSAVESHADLCVEEKDIPASLVADLVDEAARNPLRESLQYRLIRLLHLTGRSAEALTAYERLRSLLADELGTDPRPELRRLHLQIIGEEAPDGLLPASVRVEPSRRPEDGAADRTAGSAPDPATVSPVVSPADSATVSPAGSPADSVTAPPAGSAADPEAGGHGGREPERTPPGGAVWRVRRRTWAAAVGAGCVLGLAGLEIGGYGLLREPDPPGASSPSSHSSPPAASPVSPATATGPQRPIPGDSSRLDADVTYPDGSTVRAGRRFLKTWKLTNTGSVAWHGRRLARQPLQPGEEGCDSPTTVPIPDTEPGHSVLVSVPVKARSTPGRCKVYWKMIDEQGVPFMPHLAGIFFDVTVVSRRP